MIEIYLKYDNMHVFGIINAFNCINNHVISCINSMLSHMQCKNETMEQGDRDFFYVVMFVSFFTLFARSTWFLKKFWCKSDSIDCMHPKKFLY